MSNTLSQNAAGGHEWLADTGTGSVVHQTSPTLITPVLGVATATSINGLTITTSTGTLTIANGKTLTVSNTLTFTGTDASSVEFGTGGTVTYTSNNLSVFAATTSAQLAGVVSDETGSGALVFANTPTLVTPVLGAATATSINGVTINASTGVLTLVNGSTLATSGANSITLTSTGATNVTLPTTGTLATTAQIPTVASQTEVDAGTDNAKIVTALTLNAWGGARNTQYSSVALDTDNTLTAGTSRNILKVTSTSSTSTSANRVITLVPSATSGVDNNFKIIIGYGKIGAGFTWKIKYSATDLVTLTEGSFQPTIYDCYWNGTTYIITATPDLYNNNANGDFYAQMRYYPAEWSFASNGGAISTITLPTQFPDGAIIQRNGIIIETREALTSGGAATVSWGYTGVTAGFDAVRAFNAVPYTTIDLCDAGAPASTIPMKLVANQSVTMTIAGAALTAGYIRIYIPVIVNKI